MRQARFHGEIRARALKKSQVLWQARKVSVARELVNNYMVMKLLTSEKVNRGYDDLTFFHRIAFPFFLFLFLNKDKNN